MIYEKGETMKVYVVMSDYGVQKEFGVAGVFKEETDAIKFIEEETMTDEKDWSDTNGTVYSDDWYMFYEDCEVR